MITTIALACWEVLRGSDCPYVPRSKVRSTPRLTRSKVGEVKGRPQGRRSTPRSKVDPEIEGRPRNQRSKVDPEVEGQR
jgi:hypothetical protein